MEDVKKMIPISHFQPPEHDQLSDCPSGDVQGLTFYPDKRLSYLSEVVPENFNQDVINKLISDMATTMYSVGGVGLSAIQIGKYVRIFICDILANEPPRKDRAASQLLVAINPEIGWTSDEKVTLPEGCLSFPGVIERVTRPAVVGIRGLSRKGKPFALRAGGMLGRVIQHEMDHLDGVSFVERMGPLQKNFTMKKMKKFHQGVKKDSIRVKRSANG